MTEGPPCIAFASLWIWDNQTTQYSRIDSLVHICCSLRIEENVKESWDTCCFMRLSNSREKTNNSIISKKKMIKLVSEINACYEGNEMRQKGKEGLVTARLDRVPCGRGDFVASKLISTSYWTGTEQSLPSRRKSKWQYPMWDQSVLC